MISSVSTASTYTAYKSTEAAKTNEAAGVKETNDSGVIVDLNSRTEKPETYSNTKTNKANAQELAAIKQQADEALAPLRRLVEQVLKNQGTAYNESLGLTNSALVNITPEIRAEATSLISDGGFYSVENTSSRLADFAISLSGGDKTKLRELSASIQKGFAAAQKVWGGQLPEISAKTYAMTMEKLNQWAVSEE